MGRSCPRESFAFVWWLMVEAGASTNYVPVYQVLLNQVYLFDQVVLLDECSQMTEPLSLLPIKRAACLRLVLVGDPRVCTGLLFPYPCSRSAQTRNLGEFFVAPTIKQREEFDSWAPEIPFVF